MTGVELIAAALAAGAGAGVSGAASAAVEDAYAGLRDMLRRRLFGRQQAEHALDAEETEPGVWEARLGRDLTETGADQDEELLATAFALLSLVDRAGGASGRYHVDARQAQGVQIGDQNTQHNTFS
ncbi:hypothetical protein AB0C33_15470 [Nonomuraea sp. NPDC048881]|uniref:hypothetical protein n=1 Tax=Nonomuraea sp. NPDC048881 TaxID=3155030 RepID=UPI0033F9DD63